jgi:hypothetical protein
MVFLQQQRKTGRYVEGHLLSSAAVARARTSAKNGGSMQIDITRFGNLVVFDEQNHPVELGSLWQDKPAVIVFVRHFG